MNLSEYVLTKIINLYGAVWVITIATLTKKFFRAISDLASTETFWFEKVMYRKLSLFVS